MTVVPVTDAVFELTPVDGNPSSRANLQFVLFYRTPGCLRHKHSQHLRESFYKALSQYPILFGRLERMRDEKLGTDKVHVAVVKDATECMPSYQEFDATELVKDIKDAHYNWAMWPEPLLSLCPVRKQPPGKDDPLVQCVVTWHADGMGLLISVDHSIADGVGIDILLNQWAAVARGAELQPVDFDHKTMYEDLCQDTRPQGDWFVQHIDSLEIPPKGSEETGAILDSDPRSPQEVELAFRANVHSLRMTPEALQRLSTDTKGDTHVPAIRLAYALVWQCFVRALEEDKATGDKPYFLNVIHSARHLVHRPHYIGNAVCPVYMQRHASMRALPIRQLAISIGQHMHAVTKPQWLAMLLLLQNPERYAKFLTVFATPRQLTLSNISRLGFFSVDFGFGPPTHATVYPMLVPGFATWLPLGISGGGIHILWNMPDPVARRLKDDPQFTRYVDFLF
ncbi:hypothetical protein GGF46_004716 [Coemansia sp. RSA 552]|nr:hypothetical protein GGF46_004716 [Coemansia sp. RSA 552]